MGIWTFSRFARIRTIPTLQSAGPSYPPSQWLVRSSQASSPFYRLPPARPAATCNAITIVVWMNNQAPSRRAPNHSISVQSTSLLSRAHGSLQFPHPLLSLESRRDVSKRERKRERDKGKERKRGSTRRRIKRKWALSIAGARRGRGERPGAGPRLLSLSRLTK